jgi:integrase
MSDVDAHSVTVGQYLDDWLAGKHALNPKTAALYRDAFDHYLVPHLGSIRRIHAALRSALNAAVKRRLIPYNPALHIELAAENPKRPKPWTAEQAQTFLHETSDDRLATLYRLMLVTGLRRREVVGLRSEDVDLHGRCLFVVQSAGPPRGSRA